MASGQQTGKITAGRTCAIACNNIKIQRLRELYKFRVQLEVMNVATDAGFFQNM